MSDAPPKRRGLGRGLSALLPDLPSLPRGGTLTAPLDEIRPSPNQPRRTFSSQGLDDLARSIREHGILVPLLVRRLPQGYQLIAGERRWRAARKAGLKEVPVIVREAGEREALEVALIENLQREDLNPVELARGYQRLIDEFDMTQEEVAARVGKDRSTVANALRLLKLPAEVLEEVSSGSLSEGHARALLALPSQRIREAAQTVITRGLSVREVESLARAGGARRAPPRGGPADPALKAAIDALRRALAAKVDLLDRNGRGRIEIRYASHDELDRILERILEGPRR